MVYGEISFEAEFYIILDVDYLDNFIILSFNLLQIMLSLTSVTYIFAVFPIISLYGKKILIFITKLPSKKIVPVYTSLGVGRLPISPRGCQYWGLKDFFYLCQSAA